MKIKDFYDLIELKEEPDVSILPHLKQLIERFPLFQAGLFIYIKCLYLSSSDNFASELNRIAPFIHDRRALFYYVFNDLYDRFAKKIQTAKNEDRTLALINAFFETTNATLELESELNYLSEYNLEIEESIESYNIDADLKMPKMKGEDLIDTFINKSSDINQIDLSFDFIQREHSEDELELDEESQDDFFFTQTLIDIYIKQKKYERAYEIIKRLSLNNPEKNIYFADQLKSLEKFIKI